MKIPRRNSKGKRYILNLLYFIRCTYTDTLKTIDSFRTSYYETSFQDVKVIESQLVRSYFDNSKFTNVTFINTNFIECSFDNSKFENVIFIECHFEQTNFQNIIEANNIKFNNVSIKIEDEIKINLNDEIRQYFNI